MKTDDLNQRAERLGEQISERIGTGGKGLEGRAARAGRALPRHVRREIGLISQARSVKGHPKLERQVDQERVDTAIRKTADWLGTVDRSARRRRAALDLVADVAFKLLVVVAAFVAFVAWRGLA